MTKITIAGVNALNEPVKLAADVHRFTDEKNRVSVTIIDATSVKLVTAKGVHTLTKHPTLNIYQGVCAGHKTHIILKKIVGQLIYW